MVRTLNASLLAALNASTRVPALSLTIEDHVLHYSLYQQPGNADAMNDLCIASDNSIIRVQVTRGGTGFVSNLQVQRITDPSLSAQWASWTTLPGSSGVMFQDGGCAVSSSGGVLRAFGQRITGGNTLWVWTSTDNGITWSGPTDVLIPPGGALLKGISSAGNNDVFFQYDVSGGDAVGCAFFSGGTWSTLTTWTFAPLSGAGGLAVWWIANTFNYVIVYSDGYTLSTCYYSPTSGVWSSGIVLAPASNNAIRRIAPRITFADNLYTLTCIEYDNGLLTGSVYNYVRLRQSSDMLHWSNGTLLHDIPATYGALAFKLAAPVTGSSGGRYYLVAMASIYSTAILQSTNTTQYLDVSGAVLSYIRTERVGEAAQLEVLLDNAHGVYNTLLASNGVYNPLSPNASLMLYSGYKTGTPVTTNVVKVGTYRLEQIQFQRSPQTSVLRLVARDLSRNLDLVARYQNTYTTQSVAFLLTEICARAGLFSVVLPTTSQMSQSVPSFVLQAGTSYRHALNELCNTYRLYYFLDENEVMQFRELSSSDSIAWTYQPEIETVTFGSIDQRANHIIVTGRPPTSSSQGVLTTAESYDDAHLHLVGVERLLHHVDPKLTTTAQCSQKASLLLAEEMRARIVHEVTVPANPALQLLDGILLTDSAAPVGSGQSASCRIMHLEEQYNAGQGLYEQCLLLNGL